MDRDTTLILASWNVNGIRARHAQVEEWIARERPDVVCLQEIKIPSSQIPMLWDLEEYWCCWHGEKGYSGVALHVRRDLLAERPVFTHPEFDYEGRIVAVELGRLIVASVYVPNGGKDFPAKIRFLESLASYAAAQRAAGRLLMLCGDLNVTRTDMDVHPKERKPGAVGQLPEERALLERILQEELVDIGRVLDPDNPDLFTWWAPWRNLRQRNIGWRIDYLLASRTLAERATACRAQREVGTSDHAPIVATFALSLADLQNPSNP